MKDKINNLSEFFELYNCELRESSMFDYGHILSQDGGWIEFVTEDIFAHGKSYKFVVTADEDGHIMADFTGLPEFAIRYYKLDELGNEKFDFYDVLNKFEGQCDLQVESIEGVITITVTLPINKTMTQIINSRSKNAQINTLKTIANVIGIRAGPIDNHRLSEIPSFYLGFPFFSNEWNSFISSLNS